MFVDKGETFWFQEIKEKLLTKNSVLQNDQGNLICCELDRSGRPGITQYVIVVQYERETSRSEEISVNSFAEELFQMDQGNLKNIPLQYKTTLEYIVIL